MVGKKLGILFLIAVILAFLTGYFAKDILPRSLLADPDESFDFITDALKDRYFYEINKEDIDIAYVDSLRAIVDSYARQHSDPYTRLYDIPNISTFESDEFYIGIGISLTYEDNYLRIQDVSPQSDAFGDIIPNDLVIGTKINDEFIDFDVITRDEMLSYIQGDLGDEIILVVKTPDGDEFDLNLEIRQIDTPSVETKTLSESELAYLKISYFHQQLNDESPGTSFLFKEVLSDLEETILQMNPSEKTLIIDLRDNPGGALTALHNSGDENTIPGILQDLLSRNNDLPLFSMIPRNTENRVDFYSTRSSLKEYDIAVLVNENSASAAEVLASVLYTAGGYQVYGMPTYGKNVYQSSINLFEYEGMTYGLTYTEGMWYYGDGLNVKDNPIPVVEIAQEGYLTLDVPFYTGEVSYNQVQASLATYQEILNLYLNLEGPLMIRTDGYFDQATEDAILLLQADYGLNLSGIIDRQTAVLLYTLYAEAILNPIYDVQLMTLITEITS